MRIDAYHYVLRSTSYYHRRLGHTVQYPDLYLSLQGPNYKPGIEKLGKEGIVDLGLAERAYGVFHMQKYDPVLMHQAPRSNTILQQGGPVGPYAFSRELSEVLTSRQSSSRK